MVSRRTALRAGGAVLAGALAGCVGADDRSRTSRRTTTADRSATTGATPTRTPAEPTLTAETVAASAVPPGATVAVVNDALYELVAAAANADGRVDLLAGGPARDDDPLALGAFDYLRFRGETYRPVASHASFAQEASRQYSAEPADATEGEGEVASYANLSDAEREVADVLLAGETYGVGYHEEKPDAAAVFDEHRYLRAGNETYRIRVVVGDAMAHHMLRLDPVDPGADARVVSLADHPVPSSVRATVTAAISNGSAAVSNPDELAAFLDAVEFVVTRHDVAALPAELG